MSNHLAIATVSVALGQFLREALGRDGLPNDVHLDRPSKLEGEQMPALVNVFLYQVTPNAAWRNADLPARRGSGTDVVQRPRAALDLHYLITFRGDESTAEPQRLLGSVARALHTYPVLGRSFVRDQVKKPAFNFLATSDLAEDVELVRFTPAGLSLEEMSKLWSVFFQSPYLLSVAYLASVVLIEADVPVQTPLPVLERNLVAITLAQPEVDEVTAFDATGQKGPITAGGTLSILGRRLHGNITGVTVAGQFVGANKLTAVTPTRIDVPLAAVAPPAGVHGVQVVHQIKMNSKLPDDRQPHSVSESNVAAFVLQPTITPGVVAAKKLPVTVVPRVRAGQRVSLLLNAVGADPPQGYTLLPLPTPDPDPTPDVVTFDVTDVPAGTYLARLSVDGAVSPVGFKPPTPTVTV